MDTNDMCDQHCRHTYESKMSKHSWKRKEMEKISESDKMCKWIAAAGQLSASRLVTSLCYERLRWRREILHMFLTSRPTPSISCYTHSICAIEVEVEEDLLLHLLDSSSPSISRCICNRSRSSTPLRRQYIWWIAVPSVLQHCISNVMTDASSFSTCQYFLLI